MIRGNIETFEYPAPHIKKRVNKKFFMKRLKYQTGGTKFIYPDKYFNNPPIVHVTIELLNLTYSTKLVISHIITSNNKTQTTIRVNYDDGSETKEIASNGVFVNIYSVESI